MPPAISTSVTSVKPLIESDRVEGTTVYDAGGERLGTIKRLMIEKVSGRVVRVVYAVVTLGGSLELELDDCVARRQLAP